MLLSNSGKYEDITIKISPEQAYKVYTPLELPTEPVAENYTKFNVIDMVYPIYVTASDTEDTKISTKDNVYVVSENNATIIDNNIVVTSNCKLCLDNRCSEYIPPELPTEPVAENYTKFNVIDMVYPIYVTANATEDTKISTTKDNVYVVSENSATIIDNNIVVTNNYKLCLDNRCSEYIPPAPPTIPVAEHYNAIKIIAINSDGINVTADGSSDVKITNLMDTDITVDESNTNTLHSNDSIVITTYATIKI